MPQTFPARAALRRLPFGVADVAVLLGALSASDAVLYSVCVLDNISLASKRGYGMQTRLNGLSEVTGGRAF